MTEASRTRQLELALLQRDEQKNGETHREPLRDKPLPVIDIPLDLPLLNHRSFRIAAQLEEHADQATVHSEPGSSKAQAIVAQLVLDVHRNVDALRDSLVSDGQQEVGIITRSGILINGNTRCILLRQLDAEGKLNRARTLRVAVLPKDYGSKEELELELVLQQQRPLKDEYRLVNELKMMRRLRDEGFNETQIAKRRGLRRSAKGTPEEQVKKRLEVLQLMEGMRRLSDPPLRLLDFDLGRDNLEAWLELLKQHAELDAKSPARANVLLQRWMIAYFAGFDSVHKLRHARETWVEDHLVGRLDPQIRAIVEAYQDAPTTHSSRPAPAGLDVLGELPAEPIAALSPVVGGLFRAVVEARRADANQMLQGTGGKEMPAGDFREGVAEAVKGALGTAKTEATKASVVDIPFERLTEARAYLQECEDALSEVIDDPAFASKRSAVTDLAHEVLELAERIASSLGDDDGSTSTEEA